MRDQNDALAAPPVPVLPEAYAHLTPTRAEVNLDHLRHNARLLRERAGGAGLIAVVKADAYGHGAERVAPALEADGVDFFAVATVPEGLRLRDLGVRSPVLVFGAPLEEYLPACARGALDVTVSSPEVAEAVARTAGRQGPMRVHVKIDTGMRRIGLEPGEAEETVRRLERAPNVRIVGLWTHFAVADEAGSPFTAEQIRRFRAVTAGLADAAEFVHLANSAATLDVPESVRGFARVRVRAGLALYGISPFDDPARGAGLRPVMRFLTRVTHVKTVPAGTPVSYGCTWRSERATRIATLGAGYADGYPRLLSNRGEVGVGGRHYPIAGRVCMDMTMIDLGPDGPEVRVGDEAVLFGEGGPSAARVARWAETIPYEITCRVSARVPRAGVGG